MESKSLDKIVKKTEKAKNILTRNPFVNFLADFRLKNRGLLSHEIMIRGGEAWRQLSAAEKTPLYEMARRVPKKRRPSRSIARRRHRHRLRNRSYGTDSQDSWYSC